MIGLLRRAGLARHADAGYAGAGTRAVAVHGFLHHLEHGARRLLREDALSGSRGAALSRFVHDQAERPEFSAVGNDGVGLKHLYAGHGQTLSERGGHEVKLAPVAGGAQDAAAFVNAYARALAEAELLQIGMEFGRTQHESYLGHADVAGTGDDFRGRQFAVGMGVVADGRIFGAPYAVFAEYLRFGRDQLFLQRRGHEQRLEGGAGFETVARKTVAVDRGTGFAVVVGVEEGILRPGKDLPGRHVGDQHASPARARGLHGVCEHVLGNELHLHVQGERDVLTAAVRGGLLLIQNFFRGVAGHTAFHARAAQSVVVGELHAFQTVAVHAHEAQKLSGKMPVRIHSFKFARKTDAGYAFLLNGGGGGVVDLALQPDEGLVPAEHRGEIGFASLEQRSKTLCRVVDVFHDARIGVHRLTGHASREHASVSVQNAAACAFDHFGVGMLSFGHVAVDRSEQHLHLERAEPQQQPADHEQRRRIVKTLPDEPAPARAYAREQPFALGGGGLILHDAAVDASSSRHVGGRR